MSDDLNSKPPGGAGEKTNFSRVSVPRADMPHVDRRVGDNSDPSRMFKTGDDCMGSKK